MGLLAQLFRHRNSPPGEPAPAREPDAPASAAQVRGVGAVAVAAAQEISATPVKLPPPAVPEALRPVFLTAVEQPEQARELRPPKDGAISTTLRAVVLGGATPAESAGSAAPGGQFLAPRIVLAATAAPVPVVLGPSVVPSANCGGITLAPRTTPDFAGLQNLFMTSETLDLAGVAAQAAALPGVRACVISGSAGSATGGEFSHGVSAEELRAASADLARIGGATVDTLPRGESDIAIFLHGEVGVAAVIAAGGFVPGVRERLTRTAELLAGTPAAR